MHANKTLSCSYAANLIKVVKLCHLVAIYLAVYGYFLLRSTVYFVEVNMYCYICSLDDR